MENPNRRATDVIQKSTSDKLLSPDSLLSITNLPIPSFEIPDLSGIHEAKRNEQKTDAGYASILFQRLMKQVLTFEDELSEDEEIGGHLASFGSSVLIRIHSITYDDPFFIVFSGNLENGSKDKVRLVQHCNQINVLFTAVTRNNNDIPARRIGFDTIADDH